MADNKETIPPSVKKTLIKTLEKCGDELDLSGWRYGKSLGMSEYIEIDVNDENKLLQFHVCLSFLKTFFSRKYHSETVYSMDLKHGAELWWENSQNKLISIDNGIMLAAIVAKGLAPDNLWLSMNVNQQALISPSKWKKFCDKFGYESKTGWNDDNNKDHDTIKIN